MSELPLPGEPGGISELARPQEPRGGGELARPEEPGGISELARPQEPGGGGGEPPRRMRSAERDELARAGLTPLAEGERPPALRVAIVVALLLAVGVVAGSLTVHDLRSHGGSVPGALVLAGILGMLAGGMFRGRYWAVLGFEALLTFQIIVTSLALVVASSLLAAGLCLLSVLLAGWLFWKLIRVMGRIQAGEEQRRQAPLG